MKNLKLHKRLYLRVSYGKIYVKDIQEYVIIKDIYGSLALDLMVNGLKQQNPHTLDFTIYKTFNIIKQRMFFKLIKELYYKFLDKSVVINIIRLGDVGINKNR